MLDVRALSIPEVLEIAPRKFGDGRGFFSETYNASRFAAQGIDRVWVQDNHSYSAEAFTLRGLHYQDPPFAQDKLLRVLRGRIWDVAVDIRRGSPSFGQWAALEISAQAFNQIYIPAGFAHGFLTLEPDAEILYKVSAPYSAAHDRAIRYDDPDLAVAWPLGDRAPILSGKDAAAPLFANIPNPFSFEDRKP